MKSDWNLHVRTLGSLTTEQRLHFFEVFAHDLTVTIRVAWSEPTFTAEQKVEAMKIINECLHRVTARVWTERLHTHEWTDDDFVSLLAETDAALHPKLRGSIASAVARCLGVVQSNTTPKART